MLTTPAVLPVTTPERFDGNQVDLIGLVTKIWARSTGDVFARLAIGEVSDDEEDNPELRAIDTHLTLQLPNGQVGGQDISLLKGDALHVAGYLSDITQWETLPRFFAQSPRARPRRAHSRVGCRDGRGGQTHADLRHPRKIGSAGGQSWPIHRPKHGSIGRRGSQGVGVWRAPVCSLSGLRPPHADCRQRLATMGAGGASRITSRCSS